MRSLFVLMSIIVWAAAACEGSGRPNAEFTDSGSDGPDADADSDSDGDGDTDADGDADGDADADGDGDADGDADGDSDADADGDTDADSDADGDGDADGDTDNDADADGDGDADNDADGDADGDADTDTDADADADSDADADGDGDGDADGDTDSDECDSLLEITVRDFNESHPDMQREDSGWGPVAGVLEPELGADRKPVFSSIMGTHTWKMDQPDGEMVKNCWITVNDTDTAEECYMGQIPMFDGEESFNDWYHDTAANQRFERQIQMEEVAGSPGIFVYDTDKFFPLGPDEGFGITPKNDNGQQLNFLFTTEAHLMFTYRSGQRFTFRGDDDLWIFVNGRLALDIGGLHLPFEGAIDFDAMAEELGILPGNSYNMDIFHAERHTSESNFRIETNISCFVPVIVV